MSRGGKAGGGGGGGGRKGVEEEEGNEGSSSRGNKRSKFESENGKVDSPSMARRGRARRG